jgi:N-acetylglutamate synthase-like GNAT family acetyltransferase
MLIRQAKKEDLPSIIQMLSEDAYSDIKEDLDNLKTYQKFFEVIEQDPNAEMWVIEKDLQIIGCAQVNYLTYLLYQGSKRAQIEAVRIHKDFRSKGLGALLINHIIKLAKEQGCSIVQLTTNKQRSRAIKFYEKLGFKPSHEGMKYKLNLANP